jgi:hypothetical protein
MPSATELTSYRRLNWSLEAIPGGSHRPIRDCSSFNELARTRREPPNTSLRAANPQVGELAPTSQFGMVMTRGRAPGPADDQ